MNKKVAGALRVYLDLDDDEQRKFIARLNSYNQGDEDVQRDIVTKAQEQAPIIKVQLGPQTSTACPYCGHG